MNKTILCLMAALLMLTGMTFAASLANPDIDAAAAADETTRQARETECLSIIADANAAWEKKYEAFRVLPAIAGETSIPPMAALLGDETWAHLARNVLEVLPYPAADAALRDALGQVSGGPQLGIIASIAFRRDAEALPALTALLASDDDQVFMAAAQATGHIGGDAAVAALKPLLEDKNELRRAWAAKALLIAADQAMRSGAADQACALLELLSSPQFPEDVRTGAFQALLANQPTKAVDRVLAAVAGDDVLMRSIAVASVAKLEDATTTKRITDELSALAPDLQALLIGALAERPDPIALDVLHEFTSSGDDAVRMAAMRALATLGDVSSIGPVCQILMKTENRQEKLAAIETLRRLNGPDMEAALISWMERAPESVRPDLIEVLVQRNAVAALDALVAQTKEEAVRGAAFRALGQLASLEQLPMLVSLLTALEGDAGRTEAEGAVADLCGRIIQSGSQIDVEKAVYGDPASAAQADVTEKVRQRVAADTSGILSSNDLLGSDPAPGVVKSLTINYSVGGVMYNKTAKEGETLIFDMPPPQTPLTAELTQAMDAADRAEAKVSLLRVLGRLGGPAALDVVMRHTEDADDAVRDSAFRVLTAWPDSAAIQPLKALYLSDGQGAYRMAALRGCVRLLRMNILSPMDALAVYQQLAEASTTAEERRQLLAGLADVNTPEAIELVQTMILDEAVQAEAAVALKRIEENTGVDASLLQKDAKADDGFVSLFDGETLNGWEGDPALWRVEQGTLVGESTEANPVKVNTFLTWTGGEPADFELKFKYRVESDWANSGIQIRSERFEGYRVRGYQPDISLEDWITGICYEEGGRGILLKRGEKVVLGPDDAKETTRFADEKELGDLIHPRDWNEYHVLAQGNKIVTTINGQVMHEVVDNAPEAKSKGVLAFQLHAGPPMKIRFRDIQLKTLSE